MAEFDDMAGQAFSTVTALMGENAVWLSSDGHEVPGRILFKNPTEPLPIGDSESYEYRPNSVTAEYYAGTFTGLKEAVDAGNREYITVGEMTYFVQDITTKFDGKTYVAHLEPHIQQ
ncbi:MAG: hypothetical protein LBU42_04475 [Prevotellaceae bacterium]|jgi:hypothetical protein|nr:hypothetical protein [Prevotellaceae bacterium]